MALKYVVDPLSAWIARSRKYMSVWHCFNTQCIFLSIRRGKSCVTISIDHILLYKGRNWRHIILSEIKSARIYLKLRQNTYLSKGEKDV